MDTGFDNIMDTNTCSNCSHKILAMQTEIRDLQHKCQALETEVSFLRRERDTVQTKLSKIQCVPDKLSDSMIRFFTGLQSLFIFNMIVNLVRGDVSTRQVITKESQIFLTLMKLRLGIANKDLAFRFGICVGTVSNIFNQCVPLLAGRLKFLIEWPDKGKCMRNIPTKFKRRYKNCRVIIDCTEFFIDRPYNLLTRAKTWSNYKHHHTMKALVGITPYGSISFVSKLWGGRISDKVITEKSGFYKLIEFGDQVMADRGFTIQDKLARLGATLVMPPFTRGRKQLPGFAVERARQLSALRIHVERAIERIKTFAILKNTMPLTLVPIASDIVTICAALSNLQDKLIN